MTATALKVKAKPRKHHEDDNVIQLHDFRPPTEGRRRTKVKSIYELYALPFFARKLHSTWNVQPTGDYAKDCETGEAYAMAFLESCDGTYGWSSLLCQIVADMMRAGPKETLPSGDQSPCGIVIGFMGTIGVALAMSYGGDGGRRKKAPASQTRGAL